MTSKFKIIFQLFHLFANKYSFRKISIIKNLQVVGVVVITLNMFINVIFTIAL